MSSPKVWFSLILLKQFQVFQAINVYSKTFYVTPCYRDDKRREITAKLLIDTAAFAEFPPIPVTPLNLIFIPLMKLITSPPINYIFEAEFICFMAVFFVRMILNNLATCSSYEREKLALVCRSVESNSKTSILTEEVSCWPIITDIL